MREIGKIWMNGRMVPFRDAKVHVLTHAMHYSTSVFEGIRCYDTPQGSAIFRLGEHIDRLYASAKLYSMKMRFAKRQVTDGVLSTVRASGYKECYVRPHAYYGYGVMGLTPTGNTVDVAISCWQWGKRKPGGLRCKVSSWAKVDSRFQPMRSKAASNYGNAVLARMEALDMGYDETIMLNLDGKVAEGSMANIFAVKDNTIRTPPVSAGCLDGITRNAIMQLVRADGGDVAEADLTRDDLYAADEIFMTGTAAEVQPVVQVDGVRLKAGRTAKQLQRSYRDVVMGRDERFASWLSYV